MIVMLWLATQLPHPALAQVFQTAAPQRGFQQTMPPPQPVDVLAPTPESTLPVLTLDLATQPATVTVGMTTTIQLVVENASRFAASALMIQLPLPPGVKLIDQRPITVRALATLTQSSSSDSLPELSYASLPPEPPAQPAVIPATDPTVAGGQPGAEQPPIDQPVAAPEVPPPGLGDPRIQGVPGRDRSQDTPTPITTAPPLGLAPYVGPRFAPGRDPAWTLDQLPAGSRLTVSATVLVQAPQADGAVLFAPQVTATELPAALSMVRGTLVLDADPHEDHVRVHPGQAAQVQSTNRRVRVQLPAQASKQALAVSIRTGRSVPDALAQAGIVLPQANRFGGATLEPVLLTATDDQGGAVHRFQRPVTIEIGYTEAQLRARGLHEGLLTLVFFNEQTQHWQPVATTIDTTTHTARAETSHFSAWNLADGSTPSALYVPTLQGFQVSSFTGAASYQIPMALPAGAAGHVPPMELSYSSAATDGTAGMRSRAQAGWVGKGWTLSAGGAVSRVRHPVGDGWDYYAFSFGGKAYDIVRGTQFQGTPGDMNPVLWTWHPVDEGDFVRVRAITVSPNVFAWVMWAKDGTRYEFSQPLFASEPVSGTEQAYIYQWLLNRVVDASGNRIDYSYAIQDFPQGAILQPTYYLSEMRWAYDTMGTDGDGNPLATGSPRYRVRFSVTDKLGTGVDSTWEYPANPDPVDRFKMTTPHERWRLDTIQIESKRAGLSAYELMSQYNLSYYTPTLSLKGDYIEANNQPQLTLYGVQRFDKNGINWLPTTTFTYSLDAGMAPFYAPAYNRLTEINNGQGGKMTISYANTFEDLGLAGWDYINYQRVTQIVRQDSSNQAYSRNYLTTYDYNWNSQPGQNSARLNSREASAKWWYASYAPSGFGDAIYPEAENLAHRENSEFRGHGLVTVREYNGATIDPNQLLRSTVTWSHQGWYPCTPVTFEGADGRDYLYVRGMNVDPNNQQQMADSQCFMWLVASELWKGRPQTVSVFNGTGSLLQTTEYSYDVNNTDFLANLLPAYSTSDLNNQTTGLWRTFTPTRIEQNRFYEGQTNPVYGKTNVYCYASDWTQGWNQYGNRTHVIEYDQLLTVNLATQIDDLPRTYATHCDSPATSVAPVRITRTAYVTPTLVANHYYASLPVQTAVFGANVNQLLANTEYFYDNTTTFGVVGANGRLTLQRAYRSMTEQPTMRSVDTGYGYDSWGNRTSTSTYLDWGTRTYPNYSPPGNSSTARTTTLAYDPTFHAFPIRATNALGHVERADYDFRMGTLTKVGGPNVADDPTFASFTCGSTNLALEITCASYDSFGRLATIVRPGDTTSSPTLSASYYDTEQPFKYVYSQKVTAATGTTTQEFVQFYDGLGRKVQEKRELGTTVMAVTDTRYDALGRVTASSQPRSDSGTWNAYIPEPSTASPLYRQTSTTYDGLGRVLIVTAPDGSQTQNQYSWGSFGALTTQTDAKSHRRLSHQDALGRLRQVQEQSGNGGSEGAYATYSTTSYSYDPLDRLIQVQDQLNNLTTIGYDALGRKSSISDPDMGAWSYSYDVNGTLKTQTDARLVTTTFSYDLLDRLTGKSYSNGEGNRSYSYDSTANDQGIGQRTGSCVWSGSSCVLAMDWFYDGRGRQTKIHQTTPTKQLIFKMSYDSADRMLTQTYPGGEVVTTSYDVAGRALSLCTSLGGCYVDNSTNTSVYTALDQPVTRKLGNGLTTTWAYTSPLAQLDRITTPGVFDRSYTYDPVGNVSAIRNFTDNQTLNYTYDHRDRLTQAWTVVGTAQAPSMLLRQAMGPAPATDSGTSRLDAALLRDVGASLESLAGSGKLANGYARLPQRTQPPAPAAQTAITLVQDNFTRTVSNGWGTATSGGSYATPSSNAANYSVNGSVGRMSVTTAGTARELLLNGAGTRTAQDVDITARIATSALPVSGGEMRFILMGRSVAASTNYHGLVRLSPSGQVKLEARRNEGGTETTLGSAVTVSGLTASANSYLRVRVQITGTTPTTVKVRVWADTATEPTTWQISQTDSSAILQQAGVVGLRTQLTSGATNAPVTGSWDDWLVTVLASDPSLALAPSYDDSFGYDVLGNLTNKDGVVQQYGATGTGTGAHPHAATTVGGASYTYDANGNLLSGGGRTLTWNAENQPSQVVVSGGLTEAYTYDADGARVTRSATPGLSTRYAFGLYELEGSVTRSYYALAGQVVALRDSGLGLSYLYGDHLGSISVSTSATGQRQGVQYFDAWGKKLSGTVSQTKRSYTGQYLDDTGLLFYNARYYDPGIGRFVSADTISPGKDDPQNRNRYSYVTNNPLTFTDPTGHCVEGYDQTDAGCKQYLADHAWTDVLGTWTYNELFAFVNSIQDLKRALGWLRTDYVSAMTNNGKYALRAVLHQNAKSTNANLAAEATSPDSNGVLTLDIYRPNAFYNYDGTRKNITSVKGTFVHEQAHIWDFASGGAMSQGLQRAVNGRMQRDNRTGQTTYVTDDTSPSDYHTNRLEDWAETVMVLTYENHYRSQGPVSGWSAARKNYMRQVAPSARIP